MGPEGQTLLRRFRRTVLFAWLLPVAVSALLQAFLGFWTIPEVLFMLGTFAGFYIIVFTTVAVTTLGRLLRAQLEELDAATDEGRLPEMDRLRRIPKLFAAMYLVYILVGPPVGYATLSVLRGYEYTPADYLYVSFGALPPVLISAFPIFFYLTDMLGAYFAPRGVRVQLVPLGLKVAVLGLFSPVVIDTVLLLYYRNRTGYFKLETLLLWVGLLVLAMLGTWLAARSFRRSIAPLQESTEVASMGDAEVSLQPQSLDEIGDLTRAWSDALRKRRNAEHALRHSQKMDAIGRITGGVAHDFNNLLTVLIGNLELLRTVSSNDPRHEVYIAESLGSAQRAAGLTRRLLAFARRDTHRPEVVQTRCLLENTRPLFDALLPENVHLTIVEDDTDSKLFVDAAMFEQVLVNLVLNARDALAPAGGRIELSWRRVEIGPDDGPCFEGLEPGPYVLFRVTDDGPGMQPEVARRVFEPFFTTKPLGKGTGLGLSLVQEFVTDAGGAAALSTESGKGSTFSLCFPEATGDNPSAVLRMPRAVPRGTGQRIVLVEDEGDLRLLASRQLEQLGYQVTSYAHAEELLAVGDDAPVPDLLMTDVMLPGISGLDLARRLRSRNGELNVLFVSGYAPETLLDAHQIAVDGAEYLAKPFTHAELGRAVRRTLDLRQHASQPIETEIRYDDGTG